MKLGIVDVGGGYRGVYAAGVLDYCLDHGIQFDLGIGVSAGSANLITFAANQRSRTFRFYTEYGLRKEYAGLKNFFTKRTFLDLDYVYGTLSNSDGEDPLDYLAVMKSNMDLLFVASEAESGNATYFTKAHLKQDDYAPLKASCAIPFICHPYPVDDTLYLDGALADPVPIQKAFDEGCDKVVLLLTRPEDYRRSSKQDRLLARMIRGPFPIAADKLCQRAEHYNNDIQYAKQLAQLGKLLIVAPDDTCGVSTLSRNKENLLRLYDKGYHDGGIITDFISS